MLGRQVFERHRATVLNTRGAAWSPGTKLRSEAKTNDKVTPESAKGGETGAPGTAAVDKAPDDKV